MVKNNGNDFDLLQGTCGGCSFRIVQCGGTSAKPFQVDVPVKEARRQRYPKKTIQSPEIAHFHRANHLRVQSRPQMRLEHAPYGLVIRRGDRRHRIVHQTLQRRILRLLTAEATHTLLFIQNAVSVSGCTLFGRSVEVLCARIVLKANNCRMFRGKCMAIYFVCGREGDFRFGEALEGRPVR